MAKLKYNPPSNERYLNFSSKPGKDGTFYTIAQDYFKEDNPDLDTESYHFINYCFDLHNNHMER